MKQFILSAIFALVFGLTFQSAQSMLIQKKNDPITKAHVSNLLQNNISVDSYFDHAMFEKRTKCLAALNAELNMNNDEQKILNLIIKNCKTCNSLFQIPMHSRVKIIDIQEIALAKKLLKKHNINPDFIQFEILDDSTKDDIAGITLTLTDTQTGKPVVFTKESIKRILFDPASIRLDFVFTINLAMTRRMDHIA